MDAASFFSFLFTDAPMQAFVWVILALGVYVSFRILNVADMSVDSLFPFAGIVSLNLINVGVDPLLSILIAILAGVAVGWLNAALHVYLHINPLLAGIVIMVALYTPNVILAPGTLTIATGKNSIFTLTNSLFHNMDATKIVLLFLFMAVVGLILYWFFGTEEGLALRASGKNSEMSKANGINTKKEYFIGMMISSALIALSGALYAQMNKYSTPDSGRGSIVVGLTIIFLGEVLLSPKSFKLSLISIGVGGLLYWLIIDLILSLPGFNTNYLKLMQGLLIVIVVAIGLMKKKLSSRAIAKAHGLSLKEVD
jgi:putative ABC transport system permease protein